VYSGAREESSSKKLRTWSYYFLAVLGFEVRASGSDALPLQFFIYSGDSIFRLNMKK
jgi:hypothetical protein